MKDELYIPNPEQAGKYVSELIRRHFKKNAEFCRRFCELYPGLIIGTFKNMVTDICYGKKLIPSEYLPGFSKLLGVSCEELLSAGQIIAPHSFHLTNYVVASSKDSHVWETYIKDENQPVLYADEYGKTVIDYALEFENYDFFKYLIKNKYIWFCTEKNLKSLRDPHAVSFELFMAGSKIKPRFRISYIEEKTETTPDRMSPKNQSYTIKAEETWIEQIWNKKNLRMEILTLAIRAADLETIKEFHGREIPFLNYRTFLVGQYQEIMKENMSVKMIDALASPELKNDDVLQYFMEPMNYENDYESYHVLFPYTKQWIEKMIENKSPNLDSVVLNTCNHHRFILKKTKEICEIFFRNVFEANMSRFTFEKKFPTLEKINRELVYSEVLEKSLLETEDVIKIDEPTGTVRVSCIEKGSFMTYAFNIFRIDYDENDPSLNSETKKMLHHLNDIYKNIIEYRMPLPKELRKEGTIMSKT